MSNCVNCGNAIFDEIWGDYKCSIYKRHVYDHEIVGCKHYNKGEPKRTKDKASWSAENEES